MAIEGFNEQMQVRFDKIESIREAGEHPYAERYETTHSIAEAIELEEGTSGVRIAGRIVAARYMGNLAFCHLFGYEGKIQFALQKKVLGERFKLFKKITDIGDFVGLEGEMMVTKTGEKTLNVHNWTFLSKTLRPLPEKFHGITDSELPLPLRS